MFSLFYHWRVINKPKGLYTSSNIHYYVMTKKSKLEKVLVIDDEPDNVEPLLDFFNKSNVPYDFVNSVSDALEHILESQKHGTPYGCVICDNHLTEQYFDLTK